MVRKSISRKNKKTLQNQGVLKDSQLNNKKFNISPDVTMLTQGQRDAYEAWKEGYSIVMQGCAGTGKSFLAVYFALKEILKEDSYSSIQIIRSAVQSRDMGFLKGGEKEKTAVYQEIYSPLFADATDNKDAYNILKLLNKVEFQTTSFLRGKTFDNAVIIVDEAQNMNFSELDTILTRAGKNCKVIICGDIAQNDLNNQKKKETSGLPEIVNILGTMDEFDIIEFEIDDIVRSGLVKSYIIAKENYFNENP